MARGERATHPSSWIFYRGALHTEKNTPHDRKDPEFFTSLGLLEAAGNTPKLLRQNTPRDPDLSRFG